MQEVQPYLFFEGRCEEALEFYRGALGAETSLLMRYKDAPPGHMDDGCQLPPGSENKVMHCSFKNSLRPSSASEPSARLVSQAS